MKNKTLLALFAIGTVAIFIPEIALAADDFATYSKNHATVQISAAGWLLRLVFMLLGIIALGGSIIAIIMLAMEKAPPQLQQVGYKGPVIALICGGLLCSITWLVGFSAKTATGADQDNDTWSKMNGGASINIPAEIETIASNIIPVSYTAV